MERKRLEEKVYELTKLLHQSQDESWNLKNKESERQRELRVLQSQFEETTRQCEEVRSVYLFLYLAKTDHSISSKGSQFCHDGENDYSASTNNSATAN